MKISPFLPLALAATFCVETSAQVCADCNALPSFGNPINDTCTQVIVAFQRQSPGDCTLNPNPKCVAHVNCVFSFSVTVIDGNCGVLYWSRYCTQLVDSLGNPIGQEQCAGPTVFPNPMVVSDYPVSCGKKESFKFERTTQGNTTTIAQPSGTCTACPSQVVGGGG